MIAAVGWLCAVAGLTVAGWLLAAFPLERGHSGRVVSSILTPTIGVCIIAYNVWFASDRPVPDPPEGALVAAIGILFSIGAAIMAAVAALPFWFLIEDHCGHRAPRA